MNTKDEALKRSLDALKLGAAMYSPAGTAHAQIAASIAACREALAQKDEQEPFVWMWNLRSDPIHKGYYEKHPASYGIDVSSQKYIWTPLYTAPPKRKPLTDAGVNEIAELVAAAEREACAAMVKPLDESLADAIRARGNNGAEHEN